MEYETIPLVKDRYANRLKSNLMLWMVGNEQYSKYLSDVIGLKKESCREKVRRDILTLQDLIDLAPACGFTLALIEKDTGTAYDLGRYLKGEQP